MTPAERAKLLADCRQTRSRYPRGTLTPVLISDLIELLEVAVACDLAAEAEAVDALRAEIDAGGLA